MDLVAAFPFPPDYWDALGVDEIEAMAPPPTAEQTAPFGLSLADDERTLPAGSCSN
jgi:hypothetical protein